MGAQKNRLTKAVLLSTHNICFVRGVRIIFLSRLFSGGLKITVKSRIAIKNLLHDTVPWLQIARMLFEYSSIYEIPTNFRGRYI